MTNYKKDQELQRCKQMIEELSIQVADLLEAMLFFAGVKRAKLDQAAQEYIESLEVVFEDDDAQMGLDEIVEVIEYLKRNKSELFN